MAAVARMVDAEVPVVVATRVELAATEEEVMEA